MPSLFSLAVSAIVGGIPQDQTNRRCDQLKSRNLAVPNQSKQEAVTRLENLGIFYSEADQVVNAEKTPVIN